MFTHYIVFGDDLGKTDEEFKKAWTAYKEALKKHNLKVTGPFGPFGVSEGMAIILEGAVTDFEKYIGSEAHMKCPMARARTISLWKMPGY